MASPPRWAQLATPLRPPENVDHTVTSPRMPTNHLARMGKMPQMYTGASGQRMAKASITPYTAPEAPMTWLPAMRLMAGMMISQARAPPLNMMSAIFHPMM